MHTTQPSHQAFVRQVFEQLKAQGDIYRKKYEGRYCVGCESFLPGDPDRCSVHDRPLEHYSETNYFFRLSRYSDRVKDYIEQNPNFIDASYRQEVLRWLETPLEDFSISRENVSWAIPVPNDPNQTFYVWFDALLGYITQTKQTPTVQVIGRDILRFHALYWLALLFALDLTPPQRLQVHGLFLTHNRKIGKSAGNAIDPQILIDRYGIDALRLYLLDSLGRKGDRTFNPEDIETIKKRILDRTGNLYLRIRGLAGKFDIDIIQVKPKRVDFTANSVAFPAKIAAIETQLLQVGDRYIQDNRLWQDATPEDIAYLKGILLSAIAVLKPLTPRFAARLKQAIRSNTGSIVR